MPSRLWPDSQNDRFMKKLTNIAKDYLEAVEVLTEARSTFEGEMAEWWTGVVDEIVKPALQEIAPNTLHLWENKTNPGLSHWRAEQKSPMRVEIKDPRISGEKFYRVALQFSSNPKLQEHKKDEALVRRLEEVANRHGVGGKDGLSWKSRELVVVAIEIQPEDPEETATRVRDAAVGLFQVVLELHRAQEKAG